MDEKAGLAGTSWIVHSPEFLFEKLRPSILYESAWIGHRRFAYDLVRFMKPDTFVELGTFSGASLFSFVQAVKDEGLTTKCHAVDTWEGDPHIGYYHGEGLYRSLSQIADEHFPSITAFHRCTFDEAKGDFSDGSIQLLHIDGYHTFEAVLHDFENWLPKLAEQGIVLFHDITAHYHDFGVYRLWEILRDRYPHLEFTHSFGLGVLFPKGCPERFEPLLERNPALQEIYGSN